MRRRIVVTRRLFPEAEAILARRFNVTWPRKLRMGRGELAAALPAAQGLLCQLTDRIDDPLISGAPALRAISVCAVGYDNVDVAACRRRGIRVAHTPGVLTEATADHAFALLLAAARRIVEGDAICRRGTFPRWDLEFMLGTQVAGGTLGIVGMGRIVRAVARRALGFGMEVLYTSSSAARFDGADSPLAGVARRIPLAGLLRRSDFVTLHVPASAATRHLIGAAELARMKRSAILINTSRGSILDESALAAALLAGRIGGAGLDVFEDEPRVPRALTRRRDVVLSPHIGSATSATRRAMACLAARNLAAILGGRPAAATLVPTSSRARAGSSRARP
ncbi:MAG TPA: D-glycerate dehydrogenase [Verrucomicrobiae bacterium]|nr:D-glycerate dehydrogenase [Verrucomicrobiae bacterium]